MPALPSGKLIAALYGEGDQIDPEERLRGLYRRTQAALLKECPRVTLERIADGEGASIYRLVPLDDEQTRTQKGRGRP
jgi:hypothetical protein